MADNPVASEGESSPANVPAVDEVQHLIEYTDEMKYQHEMGNLLASNPGLPYRFHSYVEGEVVPTTPELDVGASDPDEKPSL
ncbi:hypothetical protein BKG82_26875 [Mycobacteroides chelonae]|uniref:Uncharacterized protein n=1 Tax=Mycobacteroides chelonae TaxID=1774 RepID=A0A1S1LHU5_MYCCH|nr:hypothetical protein [Mycobacteroides chelonae]OHU47277.1 hypothetical protein BKG82_26875 [Mycobacteroides chelonae]